MDDSLTPSDAPAGTVPDSPRVPRRIGRRTLALLVLLVPLVAAAVWASLRPAEDTATPDTTRAPDPVASALDDASAQSSFSMGGLTNVQDGSRQLAEGAGRLRGGSDELASGMDQLQSGVGQAGRGATEVAGGVDQLVGAVRAVAVVQGQASGAIDDALGRLTGEDPEVVRARGALTDLREQLATRGLDQNTLNRVDSLKTGADELARQLSAPGAPLHDGVYRATNASHQLRDGATALADGSDKLRDGTEALGGSVERTNRSISTASRARAAERGDERAAGALAAADTHRRTSSSVLGLGVAVLVGTLLAWALAGAGRGGVAVGGRRAGAPVGTPRGDAPGGTETTAATGTGTRRRWFAVVDRAPGPLGPVAAGTAGLVLAASVIGWALATTTGLAAGRVAGLVALVLAATWCGAMLWRAVVQILGTWTGRVVAIALTAAQICLVWWVWVAGSAPRPAWTVAGGTPLGRTTAALDAVLLGGSSVELWTGVGVLAATALCAAAAVRLAGPAAEPAPTVGAESGTGSAAEPATGAGADTGNATGTEAGKDTGADTA